MDAKSVKIDIGLSEETRANIDASVSLLMPIILEYAGAVGDPLAQR